MLPRFVMPALGYAAKKVGDYMNGQAPRGLRAQFAAIAEGIGAPFVLDDEEEFATMSIRFAGDSYKVIAGLFGDAVRIHVLSNIEFPHGGLPAEVCRDLMARNRKLPKFDWDSKDGDKAYFFVKTQLAYRSFRAETFLNGLKEIIPEVAAFDRALAELGYV